MSTEFDQLEAQLDEIMCPRCMGTGTVPAMSDNGPDAYEIDVCCDHCDGAATASGAYRVLSAYYAKARMELIQLRYFKHCAEQRQADDAALIAQLAEALRTAHKHLEMHSMEVSHCNDAAAIRAALLRAPQAAARAEAAAPGGAQHG